MLAANRRADKSARGSQWLSGGTIDHSLRSFAALAILNVLFLTTDGHQNVMNDVFVDKFTDPAPMAYEVMTGPIASVTWQQLLLGAVGPQAVAAQQAIQAILGAQCRNMDTYAYGVIAIDAAQRTATISLKDGTPLKDGPVRRSPARMASPHPAGRR